MPSVKPQAHEAYLKGRHHWNKWTEEGFWKGIEYFQQAIAEDENYALGYAGLANSYALLGGFGVLPPKESCPKAKVAAAKALVLDDTLAEAHCALAWVKMNYDWDWSEAEREFKLAIELNPSYSTARFWYSLYLAVLGRRDEALAEMKRARALDPLSPNISSNLAWLYLWERHYDQAIEQLQVTLELDPNFSMAHFWLGNVYLQTAAFREAITEFRKALSLSGAGAAMLAGLGRAYAMAGMSDKAKIVLEKLTALSKRRYISSCDMASIYSGLGETGRMYEWLERAYLERDAWLSLLKLDPRFESHRADSRMKALFRRIGLPPQVS